jgi:hypothetical protein
LLSHQLQPLQRVQRLQQQEVKAQKAEEKPKPKRKKRRKKKRLKVSRRSLVDFKVPFLPFSLSYIAIRHFGWMWKRYNILVSKEGFLDDFTIPLFFNGGR